MLSCSPKVLLVSDVKDLYPRPTEYRARHGSVVGGTAHATHREGIQRQGNRIAAVELKAKGDRVYLQRRCGGAGRGRLVKARAVVMGNAGRVASFFLMKKSTVPEAELMAMLHGASAPPSASDLQFGSSPLANADVSFRL